MDMDKDLRGFVDEIDAWRKRASVPGRAIVAAVVGVLALVLLFNTLYQVQPEEVGVVLRLGRFTRTTEPGLRMKIPLVEEVPQDSRPAAAQGGVRLPHPRSRRAHHVQHGRFRC